MLFFNHKAKESTKGLKREIKLIEAFSIPSTNTCNSFFFTSFPRKETILNRENSAQSIHALYTKEIKIAFSIVSNLSSHRAMTRNANVFLGLFNLNSFCCGNIFLFNFKANQCKFTISIYLDGKVCRFLKRFYWSLTMLQQRQ